MTDQWRPDIATLEWCFANADEAAIGAGVIAQLRQRIPELVGYDAAVLGEAAVESALYYLFYKAQGFNPSLPPHTHDELVQR